MNFADDGLGLDSIERDVQLWIGRTGSVSLVLGDFRDWKRIDKLRERADVKGGGHGGDCARRCC